jgi:hypothetical protein
MAISFPASPTNGQVYQGYYYDSTLNAWKASPISAGPASVADTAPAGAIHGDVWYNSLDGTIYIYYVDGTSSQWVETRSMPAPYVASSSTARDTFFGVPSDETARLNLQNSGVQCFRSDKGWTEQYLSTYNSSTNPGGATPAGWYPFSGTLPAARLQKSTTQLTAASSAKTRVDFNVVQLDTSGMSVPNQYSLTAPVAGLYQVNAKLCYQATGSTVFCFTTIFKNGSDMGTTYFEDLVPPNGSQYPYPKVSALIPLAAGDYVGTYMSSGTTGVGIQYDRCSFEMIYLGPMR